MSGHSLKVAQEKKREGRVILMGAGPGDPELITLKAVRLLGAADVILLDALANSALLEHARDDARVLDVGKIPGGEQTPQELTCALLVQEAQEGRCVVRLKGGDPFVLGRGGEEALACAKAGVPFEVVPGVSSAVAAPAAACIPVTHRGVSAHFSVVTGHPGPSNHTLKSQWTALARAGGTLVFLMGVAQVAAIRAALLQGGRSPTEPAAFVERATCARERVVHTTVGELARDCARAGVRSPAVIVVGDVVQVGAEIRALAAPSAQHLARGAQIGVRDVPLQ